MKLVNENIEGILKPKDHDIIVNGLIENGSLVDKYNVVLEIFNNNYDLILEEFEEKGIDKEDLVEGFVSHCIGYRSALNPATKLGWILADILKERKNEVTPEIIKKVI